MTSRERLIFREEIGYLLKILPNLKDHFRVIAEDSIREGARIVLETPQIYSFTKGNATTNEIEAKIQNFIKENYDT